MVDRHIYVKRHLIALLLTGIIFTIGLLIGFQLTEMRLDYVQESGREQKADFESLQLQYLYLDSQKNNNESCFAFSIALDQSLQRLEESRLKLENYLEGTQKEEFLLTKREYILSEVQYWILARQANEVCQTDSESLLFFYTNDEICPDCGTQGYILTYLKSVFHDKLLVFSFDVEFEEPMIALLKQQYNITTTPSLVISESLLSGLQTKEAILSSLCQLYDQKPAPCLEKEI